MFGLDTLDVSIGVILFFLQVSLLCSTIREGVETFSKARAGDLERGLREMLDDPKGLTIVRSLFEHAQLSSLFPGDYDPGRLKSKRDGSGVMPRSARASLPSYIPAGQFAVALMDIVARGRGDWPYPVDPAPMTVDLLRQRAATLPSGKLQRAMLSAIDHGDNDLGKIKANLERWYDGTMDRVSGWYKRRTQIWLLGIGLVLAVVLNLDAITVAQRLASDKTMRQAFVAQAEKAQPTNGTPSVEDLDAQLSKLRELGAPIGWAQGFPGPQNSTGALANGWSSIGPWLMVIFGWLVTAGAISFGAPFWFDVLNKFMVIRSTVKPREKSQEEGSEDRQPAVGANRAAQAPAAAPAARAAGPAPAAPVAPGPPPAPTNDDMEFEPDSWAAGFHNVNEVVV